MDPNSRVLVIAAAWAATAALAAREAGLIGGVAVVSLAVACTIVFRRAGPWIWALPAALAAVPETSTIEWPRPGPVAVRGTVEAPVRRDPIRSTWSFPLRTAAGRVLLTVQDGPAFAVLPGDAVEGVARLPEQPVRMREGRMPRLVASAGGLRVRAGWPSLTGVATALRLHMQSTLRRHVPGERGDLLCHLVLGSGPELAPDLVAAHRATGLSHLLAVSGAHLTMLGLLCGAAFALITRRSPMLSPWFRHGCAVVLLLYGTITGMEPPVFRATIAAFVFLAGASHGRRVPTAAILALPALCTAVLAPGALLRTSFCLSYAAVIGLSVSGGLAGRTRTERFVRGPMVCSLWATLCTMPFTLWYFGQIAPWTILATPILGPVIAAMLGLGILLCCVAPVSPWLANSLGLPLDGFTYCYCAAVRAADLLPGTPIVALDRPSPLLLIALVVFAAGLCAGARAGLRRSLVVVSLATSLPHFLPPLSPPPPSLRLLAVGHGHAALLTLPDPARSRVLVDCGSLGAGHRAARTVSRDLLPARSVAHLIVTHGDADHVGGIPELVSSIRIGAALLPSEMRGSSTHEVLAARGTAISFLGPGQTARIGRLLRVTRPLGSFDNDNDRSAFVTAELPFRVLLTGDALEAGVRAFLRGRPPPVDVLVLPHHGRPHGAVDALLEATRPRLALVSAAARDGITAQAESARGHGCVVLQTGRVGTIDVRGDPPQVTTEYPWLLR